MKLPIKIKLPDGFLDEEVRCDYVINEKTKAIWAVEIDLYKELERVAKKYGLTIVADSGTILGAVRHHGFIPWDDDMDLYISRKDYDILCKVAKDEFKYPYFWQTEESDPGSLRGHGQLRNSKTTAILQNEHAASFSYNQGIFIDVFPFDNVPDDNKERELYLKKMYMLKRKQLRYRNHYCEINNQAGFKHLLKALYLKAFKLFNKNYNNKSYVLTERNKRKYYNTNTSYMGNLAIFFPNNIGRTVVKKSWYKDLLKVPFEFININVPKEYVEYLNSIYGDWEKMVVGDNAHGETIFDPYRPYTEYLNK